VNCNMFRHANALSLLMLSGVLHLVFVFSALAAQQVDKKQGASIYGTTLSFNRHSVIDSNSNNISLANDEYIKLPGKYDSVRTGGGGRFLVFHFKELDSLKVFDVVEKTFLQGINVGDQIRYAAGKTKIMIFDPDTRMLQRRDLTSLRLEEQAEIETSKVPEHIVMGSDCDEPLAAWTEQGLIFWDPFSLQELKNKAVPRSRFGSGLKDFSLASSPNGKVYTAYGRLVDFNNEHPRDKRLPTIGTDSGRNMYHEQFSLVSRRNLYFFPNNDASIILMILRAEDYRRNAIPTSQQGVDSYFPVVDQRYVLAAKRIINGDCEISVCESTALRPVFKLDPIKAKPENRGTRLEQNWEIRGGEQCIRYLPEFNMIVFLPLGQTEICLRRFDLEQALAQENIPYLFVNSKPNIHAEVGQIYQYQLSSLSSTPVTYEIAEGPPGMTVDQKGMVKWPVADRPIGGSVQIAITAKSSEDLVYAQSYELFIDRKSTTEIVNVNSLEKQAWYTPAKETGYVPIDQLRVELRGQPTSITRGQNDTLLCLIGTELCVINSDGWTIAKVGILDREYKKMFERENYFVAIAKNEFEVFIIDKQTLQVSKSLRLPSKEIIDLVIHPSKPYSFVTVKSQSGLPFNRIIRFDELSGEGTENDNWAGNYLAIDRSGEFMYAAYEDSYRAGSQLRMDPNVWTQLPMPGRIFWIIKYKFDAQTMPIFQQRKPDLSSVATGMEISSDGKRIVHLSQRGYPFGSYNLAGWETDNFQKIPMVYLTKDVGDPQFFKFHPCLPIAVSKTDRSLVFFDANTGDIQSDRIENSFDVLTRMTIHNVCFSPDGKNLSVIGTEKGINYIYRIPLRLSPDEHALIASYRELTSKLDQ
jgi:WD40 repeat protein